MPHASTAPPAGIVPTHSDKFGKRLHGFGSYFRQVHRVWICGNVGICDMPGLATKTRVRESNQAARCVRAAAIRIKA